MSPRPRVSSKIHDKKSLPRHVLFVQPDPRHPPVSVAMLGDMLRLELLMGRTEDFLKRLQGALDSVARGVKK